MPLSLLMKKWKCKKCNSDNVVVKVAKNYLGYYCRDCGNIVHQTISQNLVYPKRIKTAL